MSNSNTFKRTLCTLGFLVLFAQIASAQSILNFSRVALDGSNNTGIAITNPSIYSADVLLTFYGLDGTGTGTILYSDGTIAPVQGFIVL